MRSMKTDGGLIQRRGVTENVISKWIHGAPALCGAAKNFEEFCEKDVDVMVLMVALTPEDKDIYLLNPGKGKTKNVIYSSAAEQKRHSSIKNHLLFLHAASGYATEEKIAQAGEELTRVLYKGKKGESIDRLRYVCFIQATARSKT
ncbi:hypothetical protein ILUMI_04637 [Ignelater luminosus]|uniref:Uncharacterized protein n=1 Tax=Ignelater luminosus TaxID=2038154 RepID=A0A8K0DC56_IGNLU|nr:hypothetical protein ILUMI_04637 [Ignelater luminosus]